MYCDFSTYIVFTTIWISLRYIYNLIQMKNLKLILLSSIVAAAICGCGKEPKACFTVDVYNSSGKYEKSNKGKVGERFYFSPMCSENAFSDATLFEYGDGTTGKDEGHEYAKPGTYTVKCKIFVVENGKKGEQSSEATQSITVLPSAVSASL